jgi:molybdate transport system substrate-binding protein
MNRSAAVATLLLRVALLFWLSAQAHAAEALRIAAAADLRFALTEIIAHFQQAHPDDQIEVIYGSSGRFRAQIEHGAPFDLYFSADIAYPQALAQAGHVAGEVMPYALGRLALWSDSVDASALTLTDLQRPEFRRIAIANPRHAPYGARAREALQAAGVWDALAPRLVFGENIAHTLQLVQSGAAEVGIVALSLVLHPDIARRGGYYLIDDSLHQPLRQGFIITQRAANNSAAHEFANHIRKPRSRRILRDHGFVLPDE